MKSLLFLAVCTLALCTPLAFADDASDPAATPAGSLEVVARFNGPGPSGIAVTPQGRVFVGFPRHADNHAGVTLAELVDGKLVPFPSRAMSLPSQAPFAQWLVSVHGMTTDTRGNLWVIDDGKRAGIGGIPDGAAKVVGFDPDTGKVIAKVVLKAPALLQDSHMNDLRVDLTHGNKGTAYISDSSFGTSPALVVVDLASGRQRRVLEHHVSTQPQAGFMAILDGKPMRYDARHPTFPVGGADAITLSPDSKTLYYAPLTSRALYSIPTALLSDFSASEATLGAAVSDLGEKGFADGMATDAQGRLYITDGEHDAILRRWPDGHLDTVVRDPRIVWPDGIATTDKYVYVTLGQWDRLPGFNGGRDLRQPPYLLVRAPIAPAPTLDASHPAD
ncbi:L-dopachrome tautomerase-related protein [Pseudoxanthomonas sp.]|uniref:L-dopachrome tautomerase-related protein n=1 Tax=Pseudoxanthomonas sp. TaxID=1871049 RepID=UPI00261E8432|nr:L-dopachrome tautomerase-related protein [Pseudoxanthomonas sp.]WDS37029.1 MAG: L-dopachrome tautomerase-related protein [Pseudoxanthomonas sp.]